MPSRKKKISLLLLILGSCATHALADWNEVVTELDSIKPKLEGPQKIANYYGRNAQLLGNGDMGAAIVSNNRQIEYHLSSNEFQGMIGRMFIKQTGGGGNSGSHTAYQEQDMKSGEVIVHAKVGNTRLDTVAYVPYLETEHQNLLIVQLTNKDSAPVDLQILLESESAGSAGNGHGANLAWVGRQRESYDQWGTRKTFCWRTGFAAKLLGSMTHVRSGVKSTNQSYIDCTLAANQSMEVVLCLESESGFKDIMPATSTLITTAKNRASAIDSTGKWRSENLTWWKNYWLKSYAVFDHIEAKKYYYGALYNMGTSYRKGFAPPGLQGLWKYNDNDDLYFLNYNFESGFFSFPSSNRVDQMQCYVEPLFSFYQARRYTTNTQGKFPGLSLGRYTGAGKGGAYFDDASMAALGTISNKHWDLAVDSSDAVRQYQRLDQQKSLSAYYAMPIINAYLSSEDMSILDYKNPHLHRGVNLTMKGVSVYEVLQDIATFYVSYITTECKDNTSGGEWKSGDGAYTYRIYDSWAREPEPKEKGVKVDVRPRDGTGDVDTNYDLSCIRHFLRGMIKIANDRSDTSAPVAAWEDILDHLADYPTTENDGIASNDDVTVQYGTAVFKECKNRPELNYYSQGRDTYFGTHGQFVYPSDEVREGSKEALMFRNTFKAVHSESRRTDSAAKIKAGAPQYVKDMWVVFNDYNNFANLYGLMARSFWDGEKILGTLTYQQTASGLHNGMRFYNENLLTSHGPEGNSIVDALNDMLVMSHLSETSGAGTIGKAGKGSDDKAGDRYIKLFPVWPKTRNASFHQILARGAFLVSAKLNGGEVVSCRIQSQKGNTCHIKNPWQGVGSMKVELADGSSVPTVKKGEIYSFKTTPGKTYLVKQGSGATALIAKLNAKPISEVVPVPNTMVLQYKFNETSGHSLADSSDNTFTGVFEGANLIKGRFGNALKFNAGNVTIPTGVFDQLKDQLTITCWIYDHDATADDQAFLYGTKANENHYYQIGIWNKVLAYKMAGVEMSTALPDNDFVGGWKHWAFTWDATAGSMAVFRNGVAYASASGKTGTLEKPDTLILGKRNSGSSKLTATIDDFRIYKTILKPSDIQKVMKSE